MTDNSWRVSHTSMHKRAHLAKPQLTPWRVHNPTTMVQHKRSAAKRRETHGQGNGLQECVAQLVEELSHANPQRATCCPFSAGVSVVLNVSLLEELVQRKMSESLCSLTPRSTDSGTANDVGCRHCGPWGCVSLQRSASFCMACLKHCCSWSRSESVLSSFGTSHFGSQPLTLKRPSTQSAKTAHYTAQQQSILT